MRVHMYTLYNLKKGIHMVLPLYTQKYMQKYMQKCIQEDMQKDLTRLGTHKGCGGFTGFADCRRPLNLEPCTG